MHADPSVDQATHLVSAAPPNRRYGGTRSELGPKRLRTGRRDRIDRAGRVGGLVGEAVLPSRPHHAGDCGDCSAPEHDDEWNALARRETPTQRLDRNYNDILQEVRVAQTGVQFLFAFLLAIAFTPRFTSLSVYQRNLFVVTLLLTAGTAALLIAPAPYHRMLFRRQLKRHLVVAASRFTVAGLVMLVLAVGCALLLVLDLVLGHRLALMLAGTTLLWYGTWWFIAPLCKRMRHPHIQTSGVVVIAGPAQQREN